MAEHILAEFLDPIKRGAAIYDRESVARSCTELAEVLRDKDETFDVPDEKLEKKIKGVLDELRRRLYFAEMKQVSRAYLDRLGTDQEPPLVRQQHIQALIDRGELDKALDRVEGLVTSTSIDDFAGTEARGNRGRIYKQFYVNAGDSGRPEDLQQAILSYDETYLAEPDTNWWHGINVVACLARAEREGIPLQNVAYKTVDWKKAAADILETTSDYEYKHGDYTWAMATAMEACIALEEAERANHFTELYLAAPYTNEFELASTQRQLREVWQLEERNVPGSQVLRILKGRMGEAFGAPVRLHSAGGDVLPTDELKHQAQLGDESTKAIRWLDKIIRRAAWIAKITSTSGSRASGTGFVVAGSKLGHGLPGRVLVTNYHVVNSQGEGKGMHPTQAEVDLTRKSGVAPLKIQSVLWESKDLDVAICEVPDLPEKANGEQLDAVPLGCTQDLKLAETDKHKMFVVGHPQGGDLAISLYDNHVIGWDGKHVRYRSPTEEGSSGSPVLSEGLDAVAVHHATYTSREANQGVLLDAVRACCKP